MMNERNIHPYLDLFINFERAKQLKAREFKLDRMRELLRLLGHPQRDLKIIHVAGSKGKGSTCVFIAHILKEAGLKVGLYTSPHLSDVRERIRVLDRKQKRQSHRDIFEDQISIKELGEILDEIKPVLEMLRETERFGRLTYFEILTAIGLIYFKKEKVDFVILETGLGGRLDATNVAESLVSVLTPISLEHTEILGNTVGKIAREKAQIIKPTTRYVVVSKQSKEARAVIVKRCLGLQLKPRFVKKEYRLQTKLLGRHQRENLSTAIETIQCLREEGYKISSEAVKRGAQFAFWPGRFEIIGKNPIFILDGAHNKASAQALADAVKENFPNKKVLLILGVSADKDYRGICQSLKAITEEVIVTKARQPRALDLDLKEMQSLFSFKNCFQTKTVKEAIFKSLKTNRKRIVLITGSLFVVAEARAVLCS